MRQFGIVFSFSYIIIFIVLILWEKPNMELFYNYQATQKDMEKFVGHGSSGTTQPASATQAESEGQGSEEGSADDIQNEIAKQKLLFQQQQNIQAEQNEKIAEIKNAVDQFRNDLVIIRNKDKDEINNINGKLNMTDSIGQAVSMNGGNNNFNSLSKTYNLNFDLDDE